MTLHGIDVSSHQGADSGIGRVIDTEAMPGDFVIVKATQGKGYRNPNAAEQMAGALRARKARGAYHFVDKAVSNTVRQEVDNFLFATQPYSAFMPIIDYEPNEGVKRPDFVAEWLDLYEQETGVRAPLYTNLYRIQSEDWGAVRPTTPLWLAQYRAGEPRIDGFNPPGEPDATVRAAWNLIGWQYTQWGYLPGWPLRLDLNVFYLTLESWASYTVRPIAGVPGSGGGTSTPAPPEPPATPPTHTPWPEPEPPTHWLPDQTGTVAVTLSSGPLYRSGTTTPRRAHPVVAEWLWWLERLLMARGLVKVNLDVYQLQGDSSLSGGTHRCPTAADVLDTGAEGILIAREMGGKGWRRLASRGWMDGDHQHIVIPVPGYNDCNQYQLDAYDAGYNGLGAGGKAARDPDPRPTVSRTPAQGIAWAKAEIARIKGTAAPTTPAYVPPPQEDDMLHITSPGRGSALIGPGYVRTLNSAEEIEQGKTIASKVLVGNDRQYDLWVSMCAPTPGTAAPVDLTPLTAKLDAIAQVVSASTALPAITADDLAAALLRAGSVTITTRGTNP